jgi:hypothetical protein
MPAIQEKSLTPMSDSQSKGLRGVGVGLGGVGSGRFDRLRFGDRFRHLLGDECGDRFGPRLRDRLRFRLRWRRDDDRLGLRHRLRLWRR